MQESCHQSPQSQSSRSILIIQRLVHIGWLFFVLLGWKSTISHRPLFNFLQSLGTRASVRIRFARKLRAAQRLSRSYALPFSPQPTRRKLNKENPKQNCRATAENKQRHRGNVSYGLRKPRRCRISKLSRETNGHGRNFTLARRTGLGKTSHDVL